MLTETGEVRRVDGWIVNEDGYEVPHVTDVYTGPMLVRPRQRDPREAEIGGTTWYVSKYDVTLPRTLR